MAGNKNHLTELGMDALFRISENNMTDDLNHQISSAIISMEEKSGALRIRRLPPLWLLCQCFAVDFNQGTLVWKERPLYHFKSERDMKVFNSRFPGRLVGGIIGEGRYSSVAITIIGRKFVYLTHRIIAKMAGKINNDFCLVDHKDMDRRNNSANNLRPATFSINSFNRSGPKKHSMLPKGVRVERSGRFTAQIKANQRNRHIGVFDSPDEAHLAYQLEALKLFGQKSPTLP